MLPCIYCIPARVCEDFREKMESGERKKDARLGHTGMALQRQSIGFLSKMWSGVVLMPRGDSHFRVRMFRDIP